VRDDAGATAGVDSLGKLSLGGDETGG